jgi:hypothetical protein
MAHASTRMRRLKMTLFSVAVGMVAGEVLTRGAVISSALPILSDPSSYADPLCDDEYWVLLGDVAPVAQSVVSRVPGEQGSPLTRHPDLGWVIRPGHLNSLGAWKSPAVRSLSAVRVGVFGDSFVQWYHPDGEHLADHLQAQLPESQVLGYGVGGYGLDQIVLKMEAQLSTLKGGQAVIGIMLTDLDRTILQFRHGPKPWFSMVDGSLTLHNDHIGDVDKWSSGPRSFFLAWIKHGVVREIRTKLAWPQADCRVAEKTALTHALIKRAGEGCARGEVECTVLMFPHFAAYQAPPDWRTQAITEATQSQGMTLVDAGQVWADAGLGSHDVYAPDRHPSNRANATLARAVAQALSASSD